MEGPAGMAGEPGADLRMLVCGVFVEDGVDPLAGRHLRIAAALAKICED